MEELYLDNIKFLILQASWITIALHSCLKMSAKYECKGAFV